MDEHSVTRHEKWMREALKIAQKALDAGEFPVGCVLVGDDKVVGRGGRVNSKGKAQNELDHAEILAIRDWVKKGKPGRELTIYSTLEPCLMCTGAILISGIKQIVFAYEDVMGGACGIHLERPLSIKGNNVAQYSMYRGGVTILPGILREESLKLFKTFFARDNNQYLKGTALEQYTLKEA